MYVKTSLVMTWILLPVLSGLMKQQGATPPVVLPSPVQAAVLAFSSSAESLT